MIKFNTANLTEKTMGQLTPNEAAWVYNGLDVCVTAEIYNVLNAQIAEDAECVQTTYANALSKMAPILEMSMRGTYIDETARITTLKSLKEDRKKLDYSLQYILREAFDTSLNFRSPAQLKTLFYGILQLKEVKKRNQKGQYTATTNSDALESFAPHLHARLLANLVLALRDVDKQISFLETELDPDNRIRCNYNIAGTNTGRLSSSMNDFGSGTNLQNVNRKLRFPFSADEGKYLVNIDLEQADGRNVGAICWNLFYDMTREEVTELNDERDKNGELIEWAGPIGPELAGKYLDACEDGDLHTTVCKMVWPDDLKGEPWPDDETTWKKFCDGIIAHGQDSFRQLSKKGGHGTNYFGTPRTMAKHLHMSTAIIQSFQEGYFGTFPAIELWHKWVINQVKEFGSLTTQFGRRRMFFGRGKDASTHRKAIAYEPQSMTGEQIDRGLTQVWRKYPEVELLNQVHDSILFQVPFNRAAELIPKILETMAVTLTLKGGRKFTVPLDAAGGWNWGYVDKEGNNPWGLKKWSGSESREKPRKIRRSFKQEMRKGRIT